MFTLSWSARNRRFQIAPPTWSSWPSAPGAPVSRTGDDGQGGERGPVRVEEVGMGAGIKQKVHFCSLYMWYTLMFNLKFDVDGFPCKANIRQ